MLHRQSSGSQSGLYRPLGVTKRQECDWGSLNMGPSERSVHLFTIEMTLDQTLGNWHHFKPIHPIKNILTKK
jgi:hypothetical protein